MKFGNKSHLNAKPRLIKFKVYNEAIQKALPIKKNLAVIADDFSIRQTSTASSPLITEIPVTRFTRVFKMYPQNSINTNFIPIRSPSVTLFWKLREYITTSQFYLHDSSHTLLHQFTPVQLN